MLLAPVQNESPKSESQEQDSISKLEEHRFFGPCSSFSMGCFMFSMIFHSQWFCCMYPYIMLFLFFQALVLENQRMTFQSKGFSLHVAESLLAKFIPRCSGMGAGEITP